MGELDGRVAIVTGAAMGIGKASPAPHVRGGAKVKIPAFDHEAGAAAAVSLGNGALFQPCDVMRFDAVAATVERTMAEW